MIIEIAVSLSIGAIAGWFVNGDSAKIESAVEAELAKATRALSDVLDTTAEVKALIADIRKVL